VLTNEFSNLYVAKSKAEAEVLMATHKLALIEKQRVDLELSKKKADKQTALGISLADQLAQVTRYEYVTKARKVDHHNTVCNAPSCLKVCHEKCKLPFTKDGTALFRCWINDNDNDDTCIQCGCFTESHTHATIEYY